MEELNHYRADEYLDTFPLLLDASFHAVENKRPLDWYHYYEYWAWIKWAHGEYPAALRYTDSMISLLTPLPNVEKEYAHSLVQKGILLQAMNLYGEALREFYAANSYAERYIDKCGSAEVYNSLGAVLFEQESFQEALYYYKKSTDAASSCDSLDFRGYFITIQNSLNSQGLCYERLKQLDSARILYTQGLEFINHFEHLFPSDTTFTISAKGVFYGNYGNTELLAGNTQKAENLLRKSIKLNERKGYIIQDAIYSRIKLGQSYLVSKQTALIPALIDTINTLLIQYPNAEAQQRLYELKVGYFSLMGDSAKAFLARERQLLIFDSLARLKKELPAINIPASFSYFSQKEELETLQEINKRNYLLLVFAVILLLFFGAIIYLVRKSLRTSKMHATELTDVNEELQARMDQLNHTMTDLESSQEENTRIMKVIAHDLRSPVSGVHGLSQIILAKDNLDKELKDEILMIQRITKDSLEFMEDLLTMHGTNNNEEKSNTDLLELIDYCVNFMQLRANEKKQQLKISGNHIFLPIYRERIWRVINNLISNAIKFSPAGAEINLGLSETDNYIRFEVRDKGIGIPEKMKSQIFSMTGDVKRSGTDGEKSFGLGLAISMQIMQAHGGRIWFQSEEGNGTSFYIEFAK